MSLDIQEKVFLCWDKVAYFDEDGEKVLALIYRHRRRTIRKGRKAGESAADETHYATINFSIKVAINPRYMIAIRRFLWFFSTAVDQLRRFFWTGWIFAPLPLFGENGRYIFCVFIISTTSLCR